MQAEQKLTVRDARASDIPKIVSLLTEVLAEYELRFGEGSKTDAEVLGLPDSYVGQGGAFWVVTNESDQILGTCGVYPLDSAIYELRKMYFKPSVRGQGMAKPLLDRCVAFARERGGKKLVLDTIHEMTRAIAFYERNGFVRDDSYITGARCNRGYALTL